MDNMAEQKGTDRARPNWRCARPPGLRRRRSAPLRKAADAGPSDVAALEGTSL